MVASHEEIAGVSFEVAVEIVRWFEARNGYFRSPNITGGSQREATYKKGWEARFQAVGEAEVTAITALLGAARFRPGKQWSKGRRTIIPVYGHEAVERLMSLLEALATSVPRSDVE